jgi:predicted NodU family carbamoyl transferase
MISLYIHTSHDGSITAVKDRKILFHHQIDRFNKFKNSSVPSFELFKILINVGKINKIFFTFFPKDNMTIFWQNYLQKLGLIDYNTSITYCTDKHHLFHASCAKLFYPYANYFLVWDQEGSDTDKGIEQETLYTNNFNQLYSNNRKGRSNIGLGKRYSIATRISGFEDFQEGKTMALSQYKKTGVAYFEQKRLEEKSLKLLSILQTLYFKNGETVCLTGGVTQNILNNTNLVNNLKNINIKACPFNGDFGISLGAAAYYENLHNVYKPLKNIYLGLETNINTSVFNKYKIDKVSYKDICTILQKEPVAIFQSKSEQGQRGLGNRSLLIDIEAPNAIEKINKIKNREPFRPFACSILEEDSSKWFNTKGATSPFMMFVFKSKKPKRTKNVTSLNNISRVQTVAHSHNLHFHNLLWNNKKLFKKPLLLNTSLNLPGHTLVETMEDLLYFFENTNLNYIYFPEKESLISK